MAITAAQLMVKVGADTSAAESGLGAFDAKLKSIAGGAGKLGTKLTAGVTAPLMGVAAVALRSAGNFEQSMNVMAEVLGATEGDMAALQAQALELGRVTSFSAGEAADAMLELAKAGMSTEQVGGAITGVLDLAAAGGLGLAESAEIAANAINAFGLEATDMTMIADLLAAAANASSVDVTDLAKSFQMSSAVFAANGQSIQEMTTALALLGNAGLQGSDAGTSLKQMLLSLTAPTDKASAVMSALGVTVYDAQGAMLPFSDILSSLRGAMAGLTDEQRNAALATIFGSDAVRAANILLQAGAEGWDAMSEAVNKSGAAQAAAAARMQGLNGAIEYFKGTMDSLLISVGLPFLDMLNGWLRAVADLASGFSTLSPGMQQAILVTLALAAAAGPALLAIAGMAAGVSALGAVLGFLLSPIGLVVAAVAALGVAFATDFMGIRTAVMGAVDTVRPYFEQLLGWITAASQGDWGPLKQGLQGALQSVQATIESFTWADFVEAIHWADFVTKLQNWGAYIVALPWADYVTKLASWAAYITNLNWSTFVKTLDWAGRVRNVVWSEYITKIDWTALVTKLADWYLYVAKLEWGAYVTLLDWGGRIASIVWSEYVMKLDWTAIITKLADWGTWVLLLPWNTFVTLLDWATYVFTLPWGDYVAKLQDWGNHVGGLSWDDYVAKLTEWGTYIANLDWGEYITAIVDWSQWIGNIVWSEFIDNVRWPVALQEFDWSQFIGDVSWATDLGDFDWGDFVSTLEWPEGVLSFSWDTFIDRLTWPFSTRVFSWSTFVPQVQWPWDAIRNFDWGRFIPSFSWPNFGGGGGADENASGTPFFGGGLTWVGERGPELVALPRGARIWSAQDSMAMAGGGNVTINATVAGDIDIERLAWRIRQELRRM